MALRIPEILNPLLGYPVAVLGGGVSGRSVLALLAKLDAKGQIFDEKQPGVRADFALADAASHRLVVFSPGFRPDHRWLQTARGAGCVCLSELDFAALFWRGTVIAVTGTNGKTTLTEFLTHALCHVHRDARATGNVGYSFSQLVADENGGVFDALAVCEVSSFQAETLVHFRADATLWTNLAEDHLERHDGMRSYFDAKWRLLDRTVGGIVLAGSSVQRFAAEFGHGLPPDACVATEDQPADVLLSGTIFDQYPQPGRHRLARVAVIDGVTFWNDSKATNFHAVEAALGGIGVPVILIAGGRAKGGDIAGFVQRIRSRVKAVFLIGETRQILADACAVQNLPFTLCSTLEEAVQKAAAKARDGDHVMLSPGFASFDMFKSYEDRGDQFEQLVSNLRITPVSR